MCGGMMILPLLPEECLRQISYSTDSSLIGIWWQQTESAGVDIEDYYTTALSDKTDRSDEEEIHVHRRAQKGPC